MPGVEDSSTPQSLEPLPEARPLTVSERAWLDHLVEPLALPELALQVASAEVISECSCGCPSIGLGGAGPDVPPATIAQLSESGRDDYLSRSASTRNSQGQEVEITLHVGYGRLVELEVWAPHAPDGEVTTELPPAP